jgi:hypothetical protein
VRGRRRRNRAAGNGASNGAGRVLAVTTITQPPGVGPEPCNWPDEAFAPGLSDLDLAGEAEAIEG